MADKSRVDYKIITELVEPGSRVLDLGCGSGELLERLHSEKGVAAQGVEISEEGINECLSRGVSAIHGDIDEGLKDYGDQSFDYVILNQTLQAVKSPGLALREMVRVGGRGIVGFPNFGHFEVRLQLLFKGRMPVTRDLPFQWHDTPNIHLLTIADFEDYAKSCGIDILSAAYLGPAGKIPDRLWPNLFAQNAIYMIRKNNQA